MDERADTKGPASSQTIHDRHLRRWSGYIHIPENTDAYADVQEPKEISGKCQDAITGARLEIARNIRNIDMR